MHTSSQFVCLLYSFALAEERIVNAPIVNHLIVNHLYPLCRAGYSAGGYQTEDAKGKRVILAKIALVSPPTEFCDSHAYRCLTVRKTWDAVLYIHCCRQYEQTAGCILLTLFTFTIHFRGKSRNVLKMTGRSAAASQATIRLRGSWATEIAKGRWPTCCTTSIQATRNTSSRMTSKARKMCGCTSKRQPPEENNFKKTVLFFFRL